MLQDHLIIIIIINDIKFTDKQLIHTKYVLGIIPIITIIVI